MVDLVKIRKKARKAAESAKEAAAEAQESGGTPGEPVAGSNESARVDQKAVSADDDRLQAPAPAAIPPAIALEVTAGPAPAAPAATAGSAAPEKASSASDAANLSASAESKLERFRREAGRLREDESSQAEEELAEARQLEVLAFAIGSEQYAADIERIVEIATPRAVTRVPNADPSIVGVISLRGLMVTIVDVRSRLRQASRPATADTRLVVVDQQGETIGFEVDRVLRVLKIDRGTVDAHPVVHASESDESIVGVFRHEDALTILLDFDKLLAAATPAF